MNEALIDLIACLIIGILGGFSYVSSKSIASLYIAAAFFLFGVSHLMKLTGQYKKYSWLVDIIRIFGFISIAYVLAGYLWM